jgi:hypothetical protein
MPLVTKYALYILLLYVLTFTQGCGGGICEPQDRYLVVEPFAGTSNRLRTIASAKIMAAVTERQLVVHWKLFKDEMPALWSQLFKNPLTMFDHSMLLFEGCTLDKITSAEAGNAVIRNLGDQNKTGDSAAGLAHIPEYQEPIVYFATSMGFSPEDKVLSRSEYDKRYLSFYKDLEPNDWIIKQIKQFKKDHDFDNKFMVGVHYRSWNTVIDTYVTNDPETQYLDEFVTEMKRAVALNPASRNNKPVGFFLATDDPKVRAKMLAVKELAGTIVTRHDIIERSTVRGQQSALVDFFLLGSTNFIIGTYQSSFSDEAAHLTIQNRKINIGKAAFK